MSLDETGPFSKTKTHSETRDVSGAREAAVISVRRLLDMDLEVATR